MPYIEISKTGKMMGWQKGKVRQILNQSWSVYGTDRDIQLSSRYDSEVQEKARIDQGLGNNSILVLAEATRMKWWAKREQRA